MEGVPTAALVPPTFSSAALSSSHTCFRSSRDILANSNGLYRFDKGVCMELLLVAAVGGAVLALLRKK